MRMDGAGVEVSEELSSVETNSIIHGILDYLLVSEELSSVETNW